MAAGVPYVCGRQTLLACSELRLKPAVFTHEHPSAKKNACSTQMLWQNLAISLLKCCTTQA